MKKIKLIFLLIILFNCGLPGQNYIPFPTDNANWNIYLVDGCALPTADTLLRRYTLSGDTTINDINYNKLCIERGDTLNPIIHSIGGLREDEKKIFYKGSGILGYPTANEEILLYDFTKKVGDTILHSSLEGYFSVVLDIDSILIGDSFRKRYKVDNDAYYHNPDYIIEGIGSVVNGLLGHITKIIPECGDHYWEHICFMEDGKVKYLNPSYDACFPEGLLTGTNRPNDKLDFSIFPNPVNKELWVRSKRNDKTLLFRLVDMHGQTLLEEEIQNDLNILDLPDITGIYNILIIDEKGKVLLSKKVVKQ